MIELKNLSKQFETSDGSVEALRHINLTIQDGDVYGIIGMSGAGKSTLVRCINMLERPTEGSVLVNGRDMGSMSEKELRAMRRKITMIFQGFNLLMQRTCLNNVMLPLKLGGADKKQAEEKARELLELVGLPDKANSYPAQLSGGQQQRVAIARALVTEPDVLLCDEATSALDPKTTHAILELIRDINKKLGITVIVITHQMSVVQEVCNRVAILENGEVVEEGGVAEVFSNPRANATRNLIYPESADGGCSWSSPRDLTDELCAFSAPLTFHLFGPGHGVQLHGGADDGRLIVPVWHRGSVEVPPDERGYCASLLLSDDHGATWRQTAPFTGKDCRANESRVAQTADGSLLWMFRSARMTNRRCCRSRDGGETWSAPVLMQDGAAVCCDAGLIGAAGKSGYEDLVVLSRPSGLRRRENMELLCSTDGGRTFTGRMALPPGDAEPGYSDLTVLPGEDPVLGLLHCSHNHVLFSRISLQTLTDGRYDGTKRGARL